MEEITSEKATTALNVNIDDIEKLCEVLYKSRTGFNSTDVQQFAALKSTLIHGLRQIESLLTEFALDVIFPRLRGHLSEVSSCCRYINRLTIHSDADARTRTSITHCVQKAVDALLTDCARHFEAKRKGKGSAEQHQQHWYEVSLALYHQQRLMHQDPQTRQALHKALSAIKTQLRRFWGEHQPSVYCFFSWPTDKRQTEEQWIPEFLQVLSDDLTLAGLNVMFLPQASARVDVLNFIQQARHADFVLMACSASLFDQHEQSTSSTVLFRSQLDYIREKRAEDCNLCGDHRVLLIELSGIPEQNYPRDFHHYSVTANWRGQSYLTNILQLLRELLPINLEHPDIQQELKLIQEKYSYPMPVESALEYDRRFGANYEQRYQRLCADYSHIIKELTDSGHLQRALQEEHRQLRQAYLTELIKEHSAVKIHGAMSLPLQSIYVALTIDRTALDERWLANERINQQLSQMWQAGTLFTDEKLREKLMGLHQKQEREERTTIAITEGYLLLLLERLNNKEEYQQANTALAKVNFATGRQLDATFAHLRTQRGQTIREVYADHRHFVILGQPGSGKTTLTRWLTLKMAQAMQEDADKPMVLKSEVDPTIQKSADIKIQLASICLLPVWIPVYHYASYRRNDSVVTDRQDVLHFIGHHYEHASMIIDYIKRGCALIVLDGIDEMASTAERSAVFKEVTAFFETYCSPETLNGATNYNRLIISSRIAGNYTESLNFKEYALPRVIIEEMGNPAVAQFFHNWFRAAYIHEKKEDAAVRANDRATSLLEKIKANTHLQSMVRAPQVATIVAYVYHNNQGQLPESRSELNREAIRLLTAHWSERLEEHKQKPLIMIRNEKEPDDFYEMLETVAYESHQQTEPITEEQLKASMVKTLESKYVKDRYIVPFMEIIKKDVGLIIQVSDNGYRFLHRTFQEYLAGQYLVHQGCEAKTLSALFKEKLTHLNWREPLLMALGYLQSIDPTQLMTVLRDIVLVQRKEVMIPQSTLLVIDALAELRVTVWSQDDRVELVRLILNNLFTSYQLLYLSDFQPMLTHLQQALVQMLLAGLKNEVADYLCDALRDKNRVCSAARLITDLQWRNPRFVEPLQAMTEEDRALLDWPIDAALAFQTTQTELHLAASARELLRVKPLPIRSDRLPLCDYLLKRPDQFAKLKRNNVWLPLLIGLFTNSPDRQIPRQIKIYHETVGFLNLGNYLRESMVQLYHDQWGEADPINALELYLDTDNGMNKVNKGILLPIPDARHYHRPSTLAQQVVRGIQQNLTPDQFIRDLFTQPPNSDALLAMAILGVPGSVLSDYASHGLAQQQIISAVQALLVRMQSWVCSLDLRDYRLAAGGAIAMGHFRGIRGHYLMIALLQIAMRQGALPWQDIKSALSLSSFVDAQTASHETAHVPVDPFQMYFLSEIISSVITGTADDMVYALAVLINTINGSNMPRQHFLHYAQWVPLCAQWGRPVASHYWPVEQLPLPPTRATDISSATMSLLIHAPSALSFIRQWLLGRILVRDLHPPDQPWYAEALLIGLTDCGDRSDRFDLTRHINPTFVITANWRDAVLALIEQNSSPYHRIRAMCRLLPYLAQNAALQVLQQALLTLATSPFECPIERAHSHLLLLRAHVTFATLNSTEFTRRHPILLEQTHQTIARCEHDKSAQALLWGQLVMFVPATDRAALVDKAFLAICAIADDHQKALMTRYLQPFWRVMQSELQHSLDRLWASISHPLALECAQGRCTVALRLLHHHIINKDVEANQEAEQHKMTCALLSGIAYDLQQTFDADMSIESLWRALLRAPDMQHVQQLMSRVAEQNLTFSLTAACVLDRLLPQYAESLLPLLPYLDKAQYETYAILASWFNRSDYLPLIRQMAALLMAEMNQQLSIITLPTIIELLSSPIDLVRFRAAQCLHHPNQAPDEPTRWYSVLNAQVFVRLVRSGQELSVDHPHLAVILGWISQDLILDDPAYLVHLLQLSNDQDPGQQGFATTALGMFDYLTKPVWDCLIEQMPSLTDRAQYHVCVLVAGCLCRGYEKSQGQPYSINHDQWQRIWARCQTMDLAALHARRLLAIDVKTFGEQVINCLVSNHKQAKRKPLALILDHVHKHGTTSFADILGLPEDEAREQLISIHRINRLALEDGSLQQLQRGMEQLIKQHPHTLLPLLIALQDQLTLPVQDDAIEFYIVRSLLLVCAAAVKALPLHYRDYLTHNAFVQGTWINALSQAARGHTWFDGRAAAIELLCYLGTLNADILAVLKRGLHDVGTVRNTVMRVAVQACALSLENAEHVITDLIDQLHNESVMFCYLSARLLTAIALHEHTSARHKNMIKQALENASQQALAKRYVYLNYAPCKLPAIPRLDQEFIKCVMRINNIPTYDFRYHQSLKEFEQPPYENTAQANDAQATVEPQSTPAVRTAVQVARRSGSPTSDHIENNNNVEQAQDTATRSPNNNNAEQNVQVAARTSSPIHHRHSSSEPLSEVAKTTLQTRFN